MRVELPCCRLQLVACQSTARADANTRQGLRSRSPLYRHGGWIGSLISNAHSAGTHSMHPPTRTSTAVLCHGHVQLVSPTLGPSSGACSQHQSTVSLYTPRGALAPAPTANSVLQRYNEMGTSPRVHRGNTRSGGGGIRCIDRGGRCVRPGEATRRGREGVCGGWTLRMRVSSSRREGRTSSDRNGTIEQTDSDGCRDRCAVAGLARHGQPREQQWVRRRRAARPLRLHVAQPHRRRRRRACRMRRRTAPTLTRVAPRVAGSR